MIFQAIQDCSDFSGEARSQNVFCEKKNSVIFQVIQDCSDFSGETRLKKHFLQKKIFGDFSGDTQLQ